jgi:hypothetical protein
MSRSGTLYRIPRWRPAIPPVLPVDRLSHSNRLTSNGLSRREPRLTPAGSQKPEEPGWENPAAPGAGAPGGDGGGGGNGGG